MPDRNPTEIIIIQSKTLKNLTLFAFFDLFHSSTTCIILNVPQNLMTITIFTKRVLLLQKAPASQLLQRVQHGNTKPQAMPNSLRNHILSLFIEVFMKMLRESDLNAGSISVSSLWWEGCGSSRLWWVLLESIFIIERMHDISFSKSLLNFH